MSGEEVEMKPADPSGMFHELRQTSRKREVDDDGQPLPKEMFGRMGDYFQARTGMGNVPRSPATQKEWAICAKAEADRRRRNCDALVLDPQLGKIGCRKVLSGEAENIPLVVPNTVQQIPGQKQAFLDAYNRVVPEGGFPEGNGSNCMNVNDYNSDVVEANMAPFMQALRDQKRKMAEIHSGPSHAFGGKKRRRGRSTKKRKGAKKRKGTKKRKHTKKRKGAKKRKGTKKRKPTKKRRRGTRKARKGRY